MNVFKWIAAALLVCTLAGCASKLESGYAKLKVGMTATQVTALVGVPTAMDSTNTHWVYYEERKKPFFWLEMTAQKAGAVQTVVNIGKWDGG